MNTVHSATSKPTTNPDDIRAQVQIQEAARIRAQLREEVRVEAWAQMRARFRILIVVLSVVSLITGGLIGHYGIDKSPDYAQRGTAPQGPWAGPGAATAPAITLTPWPLQVYVSGAVASPQVVTLQPGSLVADALDAAGGPAPDADLEALNLAAPISDNQQVLVPRKAALSPPASGEPITATTLVNINTATAQELTTLPDIGPTRAEAIVIHREANGPFARPEDLMEVPGIGPTIYARISALITVEP